MDHTTRRLVVAEGPNIGAQLVIGRDAKLVGRARDADLMLDDRAISRRHFHIVAAGEGAHVQVCDGASPLVLAGREIRESTVKVGDSMLVGHTVLVLADSHDESAVEPPTRDEVTTTVDALLKGGDTNVRGFAALFALNEALSAARDLAALEQVLANWASVHARCESIEMVVSRGDLPSSADQKALLETTNSRGGTRIFVPAHGTPAGWLAFATKFAPDQVTDSLRRLLVLAAAVCGSRFAQLSRFLTVSEERESLRRQAVGSAYTFLGSSPAAEQLARVIPKLAASEVTVLLLGETGVGKSFVARLIHESGARKDEPLRVINCASIPENLIESELFGHERGAFTGAVATQMGAFEAAGRGTVLLDEIGELPLASQAKLLRALEERRYERLGSNRPQVLQARIIAATNRDLEAMVAAKTFRRDLFFRVSVVTTRVPALRERGADLVLLAKQLLADLAPSAGRRIDGFSEDGLDAIRRYSWPGNVRELRNAIEYALVLGDGSWIGPSDLPIPVHTAEQVAVDDASNTVQLPGNLEWIERRAIEAALRQTKGNRSKAAALLGINRTTLYNKMRDGAGST
ncbi:MAG TPA: sigma 54-interacting transcriptional regulator [Polyangiaceae bacterium]|nr:sigma 54-interacting transcriptional regulator [Polyangiaceae bacterium]